MLAAQLYDSTLTGRIREGWADLDSSTEVHRESLRAALERVEQRLRSLLPGPEVDRVLSLIRPRSQSGEAPAPSPRAVGPMSRSASEMIELSAQLDAEQEPPRALAIGEHVARRAHEVAHTLETLLSTADPGEPLRDLIHRLLAFASELLRNALARIRQFASALGVSSVSVTLATIPPEFSITFTFGAS